MNRKLSKKIEWIYIKGVTERKRYHYNNTKGISRIRVKYDRFNDVTLHSDTLPESPEGFCICLIERVNYYRKQQKNAIWINLQDHMVHLLPYIKALNFKINSFNDDCITLVKWLPVNVPNGIVPRQYHKIGITAMVFTALEPISTHPPTALSTIQKMIAQQLDLEHPIDNGLRILMVIEKNSRRPNYRKFITGGYKNKEYILDTAKREIREEVGQEAQFISPLGIWNRKGQLNDLYMGMLMFIPNRQPLKLQPDEIAHAEWLSIPNFLSIIKDNHFNETERIWFNTLQNASQPLTLKSQGNVQYHLLSV